MNRDTFDRRMARIGANLDDLQAGIEASTRAVDVLQTDTTKFNSRLSAPALRAFLRHLKDLGAYTSDQREVIEQLREAIARLQQDFTRSNGAVRPPPYASAERLR